MKRTSNEIGNDTEEKAAKILGGSRVKQSGGGHFWKCDIKDRGRFIWSCKGTEKDYIRVTKDMLREVQQAARGVIGTGDGYRAGMILEMGGKMYALTEIEDFAEIITSDPGSVTYIEPSKAAQRLSRTRRSL